MAEPLDFGEELPSVAEPLDFGEELPPASFSERAMSAIGRSAAAHTELAEAAAGVGRTIADTAPAKALAEWAPAIGESMLTDQRVLEREHTKKIVAETVASKKRRRAVGNVVADAGAAAIGAVVDTFKGKDAAKTLAGVPELDPDVAQNIGSSAAARAHIAKAEAARMRAEDDAIFAEARKQADVRPFVKALAEADPVTRGVLGGMGVRLEAPKARQQLGGRGVTGREVSSIGMDLLELATRTGQAFNARRMAALNGGDVYEQVEAAKQALLYGTGPTGAEVVKKAREVNGPSVPYQMLGDMFGEDGQAAADIIEGFGRDLLAPSPLPIPAPLTRVGVAARQARQGARSMALMAKAGEKSPAEVKAILEATRAPSLAQQFATGERALLGIDPGILGGHTLAKAVGLDPQVGALAVPGLRAPGRVVGSAADMVKTTIENSPTARRMARAVNFNSLLPALEQDARYMAYFSAKEKAAIGRALEDEWKMGRKAMRGAGAFDRAATKGEAVSHDLGLLDAFEKGTPEALESRLVAGLADGTVTAEQAAYLRGVKGRFDDLLKAEQEAGVTIEHLGAQNADLTYLTHAMTKEAIDEIGNGRFNGGSPLSAFFGSPSGKTVNFMQQLRAHASKVDKSWANIRVLDMSVTDANRFAREFMGLKADLFHTDVPSILLARAMTSLETTSARDLLSRIGSHLGQDIVPGARLADDMVAITEGPLAGKALPYSVHEAVTEFSKATAPEAWGALGVAASMYTKWWRAWTLFGPDFHARNMVGNLLNNHLAGVNSPGHYYRAIVSMTQSPEALARYMVPMADGSKVSMLDLVAEMKRTGVDKTQFSTSFERTRERLLKEEKGLSALGSLPLVGTDPASNALLRANVATGEFVEQHARRAHYLAKRMDGMTPEQAALSVKKYLFDYSELSPLERNVLRPLIPFYGFLKNNFALQLSEFFTQPSKYGRMERTLRNLEDPNAPPKEYYSEWQQRAGARRTGKAVNGLAQAYTTGGYSTMWDVAKLGAETNAIGEALHPMAKALLRAAGVDVRGRTVSDSPRRKDWAGFMWERETADILDTASPGVVGKLIRGNPFGWRGKSGSVQTVEGKRVEGAGTPSLFGDAQVSQRRDPSVGARVAQATIGTRPWITDLSANATRYIREDRQRALATMREAVRAKQSGDSAEFERLRDMSEQLMSRSARIYEHAQAVGIPLSPEVNRLPQGQRPADE